jgi:hypothetical protein
MWSREIAPSLELLEQGLPASRKSMSSFVNISHRTMGIFCETLPAFENVWTKCQHDLDMCR